MLKHHLTTLNHRRKPRVHDQPFVDKVKILNGLCMYMIHIYIIHDIQNTQSTGFSYFNDSLFLKKNLIITDLVVLFTWSY